jgi:purine-binding chemotaxis protein CheW
MVENVTPVPNALPYVEGVILTRGQIIPLINLRIRFGFPRISTDLRARMLVVRSKVRTAGLLVDGAREFIPIAADMIHATHETFQGISNQYVKGVATVGERAVLILNLREVTEGV